MHLLLSELETDIKKEHRNYVMDFVNYTDKESGYGRKLLTNMEEFYDCIQIDRNFFMNCFECLQ